MTEPSVAESGENVMQGPILVASIIEAYSGHSLYPYVGRKGHWYSSMHDVLKDFYLIRHQQAVGVYATNLHKLRQPL